MNDLLSTAPGGSPVAAADLPPEVLSTPPDWYPDPLDPATMRWWDGSAWTDATRPATPGEAPRAPGAAPAAIRAQIDGLLSRAKMVRNRPRAVVIGVLLVVWLLGVANAVSGLGGPSTTQVEYSLRVATSCYAPSLGYRDISSGTQVQVFDGSGAVLGFGTLGSGTSGYGSCTYGATFTVNRSPDGIYRVTAGNTNRGYLSFTSSDIVDGTLVVSATLGS